MFEELDDKLELDLFNKTQPEDFVEDTTDNKYANKKKMSEVCGIESKRSLNVSGTVRID